MSKEGFGNGERTSDVSVEGGLPGVFIEAPPFFPLQLPQRALSCPARVDISLHLQHADGPTVH